MSNRLDHGERWHDDVAAYALHALGEREATLLEQHLDGCDECSERLRWIAPAVDVIPASVEQHVPPPYLRERLMAVVREESAAEGATATTKSPEGRRRWLPSFEAMSLPRWPALAGAAAVLLLVAGLAGYQLRDGTSSGAPETQVYAAKSELPTSTATGTLRVNGDEGSLRVVDLPPTEKGQIYQAWIQDEQGSVHASSVFVLSKDGTGEVSIPAGLASAAKVMVTREPKGGSETPHENPLVSAALD